MDKSFKNATQQEKEESLGKINRLRNELDREVEKWLMLPDGEYTLANNLSGGSLELDEATEMLDEINGVSDE